jgi:hypothetical protein
MSIMVDVIVCFSSLIIGVDQIANAKHKPRHAERKV